jgi:hypothetical protein
VLLKLEAVLKIVSYLMVILVAESLFLLFDLIDGFFAE